MTLARNTKNPPQPTADLTETTPAGYRHSDWRRYADLVWLDAFPPEQQPPARLRLIIHQGKYEPDDRHYHRKYLVHELWTYRDVPEVPDFETSWYITLLRDDQPLLHYALPGETAPDAWSVARKFPAGETLTKLLALRGTQDPCS